MGGSASYENECPNISVDHTKTALIDTQFHKPWTLTPLLLSHLMRK